MYTIVIVDDESGSYNMLRNFIRTHIPYFSVTGCFSSAADALAYLTSRQTDVVITDIKMPVMDGIEFTRLLRENNVSSKIIFLSGYGDFKYAKKAIEYGVFDYLLKPVSFSELSQTLERIKELLDSSPAGDDELSDFFVKMFTVSPKIPAELRKEFLRLEAPFGIEDFCGFILKLELNNYGSYIKKHRNSSGVQMDDAIANIIRMSVPDLYVFQIYSGQDYMFFVIICKDDADVLSKISFSLKSTLPLSFNLLKAGSFKSFDDALATADLATTFLQCENSLSDNDLISNIKEYLKNNYNKNIYLADIGKTVNMNSVYLSRIFKQQTGMSPYEYHLSIRMNKAIALLAEGCKVEYIANVLGYADKRCFFRNFKSYTGHSPGSYKNMISKINNE